MLDNVHILDLELVKSIKWDGNSKEYDMALRNAGPEEADIMVINPYASDTKPFYYIYSVPKTKKCVVWSYKGEWIAKYFPVGWNKKKGYISKDFEYPKMKWIKNPALSFIYNFNNGIYRKHKPDPWQCQNELVWYVDPGFSVTTDRIWAFKAVPLDKDPIEVIDMGHVQPDYPKRFDVVFISSSELNAEQNWQRLISKAPYAKRVHGAMGIFEAHKLAATLSTTEMFFVVDGDAWVLDSFEFDHRPNLFDRDVTFVWKSKNPFNNLDYGYGGIKLLNKFRLLKTKKWSTLDLATTVSKNFQVVDQLSVETRFNTDPFTTWRSAFRESVKLSCQYALDKLKNWVTQDADYRKYAQAGIRDGVDFYNKNINNQIELKKINDFRWLKNHWDKLYSAQISED